MTVNTTNITSGPYLGNSLSDTFSYTFRVSNKTQLSVYETDAAGVQTLLVVDTDYTVSGVGVDAGGTIVRTAGNLPTNYTWYIRSNYIENQKTDFRSQGAFFPSIHEDQMDHLTFLVQQLSDKLKRSFSLADFIDIDGTLTIPQNAADRSSQYLAFGPTGDLIIASGTGADAGLRTDLASILSGQGASLIGVRDPGGYFPGANIEDVLQNIGSSTPVLLATKTANNSPTIEFTSADFTATTYKRYRIEIYGLLAATLTNDLRMRVSQAGAFITASDYHTQGAVTTSYTIIQSITMPTGYLLHGSINMYIANGTDQEMGMSTMQVGNGSSGGVRRDEGEHSRIDSTQTDGFQLFFGTGNITSGVFKLFGIPD